MAMQPAGSTHPKFPVFAGHSPLSWSPPASMATMVARVWRLEETVGTHTSPFDNTMLKIAKETLAGPLGVCLCSFSLSINTSKWTWTDCSRWYQLLPTSTSILYQPMAGSSKGLEGDLLPHTRGMFHRKRCKPHLSATNMVFQKRKESPGTQEVSASQKSLPLDLSSTRALGWIPVPALYLRKVPPGQGSEQGEHPQNNTCLSS